MRTWFGRAAAVLAAAALWSAPAQAGFGGRGGGGHASGGRGGHFGGVNSGGFSGYRGGYAPRYSYPSYGYRPYYYGYRPYWGYSPWAYGYGSYYGSGYGYGYNGYGPGYYGNPYAAPYGAPGVAVVNPPPGEPSPLTVSFGANAAIFGGGNAGVEVGAAFEGRRFGVNVGYTGLGVNDGFGGWYGVGLLNGMVSYAVLDKPFARLRLEGGGMSAFVPATDFAVLAPGVGASAELGLIGPLLADASVRVAAWPFREVDAKAGLALALGAFRLKAGVRSLYLNDAGRANGVANWDYFFGPYGGIGFVF